MTDLEDAWDGLSANEPPVDAIITEGRRRHRNRYRRPAVVVGAAATLATAFGAGLVVDGIGTGGGPGDTTTAMRPVAFQADLEPASSCDALLASYRERGAAAVSPYGWSGPTWLYSYGRDAGLADLSAARTKVEAQSSSATGTNVQEAGVDEPDIVKTDGDVLVRLKGNDLQVYDVTGEEPRLTGSVRLSRFLQGELLLHDDTVVAIGSDADATTDQYSPRGAKLVTVSIADPTKPTIENTTTYSSRVVSARQYDETIRLVLADDLPALNFVDPSNNNLTEAQALKRNQEIVEATTIEDWLPRYTSDGGPRDLVDCNRVAVPSGEPPLGTTSVVGLTFDDATPSAIALAGSVDLVYSSTDRLYLADRPYLSCAGCYFDGAVVAPKRVHDTTHVYEFEFEGVDAIHVASGEVDGVVADRWSMDEAGGVLRLAVAHGSDNSLVTLRRNGQRLDEIGRVDKIGPGEDIKAVRWFDDLAVIVTFLETDPLYTIDLSNPDDPELLGELKIPGFSDYLHPVGDDLLLGVGYDGQSQSKVKVSLYDVSDLKHVVESDTVKVGRMQALAPTDPRTFTWLSDRNTALTVVEDGRNVSVLQVGVKDGGLTDQVTRIKGAGDPLAVRTLEVSDGRVVLVTADDVVSFDLG